MKKIAVILISILFIASCEKNVKIPFFHKKAKPCPSVSSESVPSSVKESFVQKYPGITVEKWFDKGDKGYAAVFSKNNTKNLAAFENNGNFIDEQNGDNNDGDNNQENGENNDDKGCNCNLNEEND